MILEGGSQGGGSKSNCIGRRFLAGREIKSNDIGRKIQGEGVSDLIVFESDPRREG